MAAGRLLGLFLGKEERETMMTWIKGTAMEAVRSNEIGMYF